MTVRIRDGAIKVVIDDMRQNLSNNRARSFMFKKDGTLRKGKGYVRAYYPAATRIEMVIPAITSDLKPIRSAKKLLLMIL